MNELKNRIDIYLIRHGVTPGNQEHRYVGRTDEGLTEAARTELESRCEIFQHVDSVITSPMKRCIQTAEILFPYQTPEIQPGLEEMDFGTFEYKNYKELSGDPQYQAWIDSNGTLPFPAGEDLGQFKRRCCQSFQASLEKIRRTGASSVAFVVHGGTIMAILEAFAEGKKSYYDWQVKNGCGYLATVESESNTIVLRNLQYVGTDHNQNL